MMTGTSLCARILLMTSVPSSLGSMISSTIRCGSKVLNASRAASPSPATWTWKPSRSRACVSIFWSEGSSSTRRILRVTPCRSCTIPTNPSFHPTEPTIACPYSNMTGWGAFPLRRLLRQRRGALPRGLGDALGHLQEIPRLPQLHGLDPRRATPEICGDDSCLVGTLFAGSRPVRRGPCQRLAGEAVQALRVSGLEAAVGDQAPRLQDKDLYHTRLRRRGDDSLHSLGAYHGPGQPHPLYAGDEIPEPGRRLELESRRQPLPLHDKRPEVLLPALAAQQCDDLVHDFAAVLLLAHAHARRAAAHLAVEAGLAIT